MKIEFSNLSHRFLKKCDKQDAKRILEKITLLLKEPYLLESIKLSGSENCFRIRVGKYRIIYKIINEIILITEIGKRQNIYK
jgi:mRNA interferase RelE/StbE